MLGAPKSCLQPGGSLRGKASPVFGQEAILESIYFIIWKEMWVEMRVFPTGKMTTLSKQQLKQLQHPGELGEGAVEHRPGLKRAAPTWLQPIMPWVNTDGALHFVKQKLESRFLGEASQCLSPLC